jgi:hypothetical protein
MTVRLAVTPIQSGRVTSGSLTLIVLTAAT